MKKTILLFLLIINTALGQVTITGATNYPLANGTFNLSSYTYSNYWATIGSQDPGTFVYALPGPSSAPFVFKIVRKQNYWYIEKEESGTVALLYKSASPSISIVPDCNTQWEVWTGVWYDYGIVPSNTGNFETLALTGSCFCNDVLSTTVNPSNIQLALVNDPATVPTLLASKGMLNYSSVNNAPMVYNGGRWEKVLLNRDTRLEGDLTVLGKVQIADNEILEFLNPVGYTSHTLSHGPDNLKLNVSNGNMTIKTDGQFIFDAGQANGNSTFSFGGSTDFPIASQNGGIWGSRGHTYVFTGTTSITVYIPIASAAMGRHLYIVNHGTQSITLTEAYKINYNLSSSSLAVGTSLHLVSNGTDWHQIN